MNALYNTGFRVSVFLAGRNRELFVWPHTVNTQRYHGQTQNDEGETIEFALIRSIVGRWAVGGDQLPDWLTRQADIIGHAVQSHQAGKRKMNHPERHNYDGQG